MDDRLRIGISACLLGQEVRYDGGHKLDPLVIGLLGPDVEWIPVCPEVEIGLGTPRPPMRLVRIGGETHMVTPETGADHTRAMGEYAERRVRELMGERLAGYIFKKSSPSCGLEGVKLYPAAGGDPVPEGRGLFAETLLRLWPDLPVAEEEQLHDPVLRERFVDRVLARAASLARGRGMR